MMRARCVKNLANIRSPSIIEWLSVNISYVNMTDVRTVRVGPSREYPFLVIFAHLMYVP